MLRVGAQHSSACYCSTRTAHPSTASKKQAEWPKRSDEMVSGMQHATALLTVKVMYAYTYVHAAMACRDLSIGS